MGTRAEGVPKLAYRALKGDWHHMLNGDESTPLAVWVPAGGLNPARRVSSGASGRLRHPYSNVRMA